MVAPPYVKRSTSYQHGLRVGAQLIGTVIPQMSWDSWTPSRPVLYLTGPLFDPHEVPQRLQPSYIWRQARSCRIDSPALRRAAAKWAGPMKMSLFCVLVIACVGCSGAPSGNNSPDRESLSSEGQHPAETGRREDGRLPQRSAPPPLHSFVDLELYCRPIRRGGQSIRLNRSLVPGTDVLLYEISPSSKDAVFVTSNINGGYDIYCCRLDGSDLTKLSNQANTRGSFTISPDGRSVVCIDVDGALVSWPMDDGSNPLQLNSPGPEMNFWLSGDSRWVVCLCSGNVRSCRTDGQGQSIDLADLRHGSDQVDLFEVSRDSRWVIFRMNQAGADNALLSRRIDGKGRPVRLIGALSANWTRIVVSPDSEYVVFRAKIGEDFNLYSAPIDGRRQPIKLNGSAGNIQSGTGYACRISPDSRHVVFQVSSHHSLYSRRIDGQGDPVELSAATYISYFAVSPDGTRVVYLSPRNGPDGGPYDLFSRAIDGSAAAVKLYAPRTNEGFVWVDFQVTPDNRRVVFRARATGDGPYELYSRAVDGREPARKLNALLNQNCEVASFQVTPDGQQVLFLAGNTEYGDCHLYARPADGSGAATRLTQPLNQGGGVCHFQISPDGKHVVYLAYRGTHELHEQLKRERCTGGGPGIHVPFRDTPYVGSAISVR